ncbi:MAG: methyltransferase domain-containing protein [Desulfuromusa sp.]|nr:methyltransferase domain-containing protein [Desulfuromusa sp.]
MKHALIRVVEWGQELLSEVIQPGDLVVDLTAGNGQDTLALFQLVGKMGQVVALDVQPQALLATRDRMVAGGAKVRLQQQDIQPLQCEPGIDLLEINHAEFAWIIPAAPQGIISNLGFLPGGDREFVTRPESTVLALEQSCSLLVAGGRLVVVVYPGHPGGAEEGAAVTHFFTELPSVDFQVLQMKVSNRPEAPFLFVAEKTGLI